jgi:hypothetical protein
VRITEKEFSDSRQNDSILAGIAVEVADKLDTQSFFCTVLMTLCGSWVGVDD